MRNSLYIVIGPLLLLSGCKNLSKPNDAEIKSVIDQYLASHGPSCTWLGQPFPVNVTKAQLSRNEGVALQMTTLEKAGLVQSLETVNRTQNPLGGVTEQDVRRYEPASAGKPYLRQVRAVLTESAGFCYGTKSVDSLSELSDSPSPHPDISMQVTYTYKIADLAPWARRPDVQNEFGDIRTAVTGISRTAETIGLQLTDKGWKVADQ